jgi:hypothetical protein
MALQNTMNAMGGLAGIKKKPDEEMNTIKQGYAQMRKGLAARGGEALRQGDVMQQRLVAQTGTLGGAGLKMAQKNENEIQRGIAGQEADVGAQEAAAKQALLGQRAERTFAAGEAEKGRVWEQKQRDTENALNTRIATWNMTQTELNDRFNRFVAAKKAGLKSPEDWAKMYEGMSALEAPYGRDIPGQMNGHWEKRSAGLGGMTENVWVQDQGTT